MNSSTRFLSLPSEIRNMIYELIVVCPEYLRPKPLPGHIRRLTPALLRTNKVIHAEACSLLYGQNCFEFRGSPIQPEDIVSFFDQIGTRNTGYIREILIEFPVFVKPDNVTLDNNSSDILATLQNRCPNLSTITTCLDDRMEHLLATQGKKVATEALKMVNHRFRAILSSSLQEIFVEVYGRGPSDYIRQEMEALGWEIFTVSRLEIWKGRRLEIWGGHYSDCESDE
ncbi:hypothetical protein V8F06_000456 [Rhypophila decipiens]